MLDPKHAAPTSQQLRHALGRFVTGVTIVTCRDPRGTPAGLTANSFGGVSLEPPLVQFSLDRKASVFPIFTTTDHFVINVLSTGQRQLSSRFALRSDGFEEVTVAVGVYGCPVIGGCLANIECEKYAVYDGGDHVIILGRVMELHCAPANEPLLFFRGSYGTFT